MFAITFMCIALFDELLFRLIEVLEDSELDSCPLVWIERKNNSSTKEEIEQNRSLSEKERIV